MAGVDRKTVDYAFPSFPCQEDACGFYFSDASIQPFIDEAKSVTSRVFERHVDIRDDLSPLNTHKLLISEPRLSFEASCNLVIVAFSDFCPELGKKAQEVIVDSDRWRLSKTNPGEAAGCCYLANCETNSNPYAVIEYEYDGTINDTLYIAHELGHLIADDFLNEAGFSHLDTKMHMLEVQGFFTQNVLYGHLLKHSDAGIRQAGQAHFVGEITRSLYDLPIGTAALEAEKAAIDGTGDSYVKTRYEIALEEGLGKRWPEYNRAERLANNILDPSERDERGICYLHQHPMASIIASGVFAASQTMSLQERGEMIGTLFGSEGPKDINDIFEIIEDKTGLNIRQIAQTSIKEIIKPVDNLDARPAIRQTTEIENRNFVPKDPAPI